MSGTEAPIGPNDAIKVTKIETFVLKNSWVFVKISTDAGITGWGEMLKDDARACAAGALEVADYLVGQDPRPVTHHWQAIHRGAFYRGGPIKTAISSGIDMALWDITGKCYGVPVYKLLGGPTRERIRVYGEVSEKTGVNAMKVGPGTSRSPFKYIEGQKFVDEIVERFKALREQHGSGVDIGVDFHGAVQPPTALLLVKALEPYHPWFYEEIVQALNVDVMAEIAAKTHIPIATGERIFTKWGFKEILEKRAAHILQPDVCYAGGITELKIIAGMAEAYYSPLAPHNPKAPARLPRVCRSPLPFPTSSSKSAATTNTRTCSPNPCHQSPTATDPCPQIPASASPSTKTSSWPKSANRVPIEPALIPTTGRL